MEPNNINAIIIATEITKGMKSVGSKALLQIKKTTSVIEYQINELKKNYKGINIYVGVGFESERMIKILSKHDVKTIVNTDFKNTNQAKTIIDCINSNDIHNLLIINNGILFKKAFGSIKPNQQSTIFTLNKHKADFDIGCQKSSDVAYLFYDLPEKWSECVLFNSDAINQLRSVSKIKNMSQLYVFEMINMLIENGHNFQKTPLNSSSIMKIAGLKDLNRAKVFI